MSIKTAIGISLIVSAGMLAFTIIQTVMDSPWLLLIPAIPAALVGGWILYSWAAMIWERLLLARAERKAAENKAAIVTTSHGDYAFRNKKAHIVQLTNNPFMEWNGKERDVTEDEWRGWFSRSLRSAKDNDLIELPSTTALLPASTLPTMVKLPELLPSMQGDLNRLVIGVRLNEAGQVEPVTISIYDLFHTVVSGSSGWGKSVFMGSLLYQMATAPDSCEFVLIDQQMHGLAPFKNCNRLRYPILREPGEILGALEETYQEAIGKRSELFGKYDADDLQDYNRRSDEYLPPVIVGVDEASVLLADKTIGQVLKRHTWELRKFGIYQFLMLTSAKGTTIDTDHRQQFASKVQLHASDGYQARMLIGDAREATGFPPGRAMIELPGRNTAIVQTPYMDRRELRHLLPGGECSKPAPVIVNSEADKDETFRKLVQQGFSRNAASKEAWGRTYAGDLVERGKRALGEV